MSEKINIRNWQKWQSYRRDRGQPPWIKVHRLIMRDVNWVSMTDAQRGQLVAMWLLAADHDGVIPASPQLVQKLCFMESAPDLQFFIDNGWLEDGCQPDAKVTPPRRQHDVPEERRGETEKETEERQSKTADAMSGFLYGFQKIFPPKQIGTFFASENERIRLAPLIEEYGADILLADVRTVKSQDTGKRYGLAWFLSRWEQSGPGSLPKKGETPPREKTIAELQAENEAKINAAWGSIDE